MVDMEIESVLRESHTYHFSYLEKKLGVSLKPREVAWHTFLELAERRNLVAHTGGVISRSYLKNCVAHKIPLIEKQSLGDRLEIDRDYLLAACDCLTELGVELGHVILRKCLPNEQEAAENHYHRTTYDLIEEGRYEVAIYLLEFSLRPPMKYSVMSGRLVDTVNLAQAYKWLGNDKKAQEVISREDWSATGLKFTLAVAVIRDDFKEAAAIMKKIGANGEVDRASYDSWPLFRKFRESRGVHSSISKCLWAVHRGKKIVSGGSRGRSGSNCSSRVSTDAKTTSQIEGKI